MVIASLNVSNMLPHHDKIAPLIKEQGIHLLALNEAKIGENYSSNQLQIKGYKFKKIDPNRKRSSIAFFVLLKVA